MSPNFTGTGIFSDDLIAEVLSFLPVKSLLRLKSVSKSWKTLISNHTFVKLHLHRSTKNNFLTLFSNTYIHCTRFSIIRFPVHRLLHNTSITLANDPFFKLIDEDDGFLSVVDSYNGLLCLIGCFANKNYIFLWNPATRSLSSKIEILHDSEEVKVHPCKWNFVFGYDNSIDSYKIVAYCLPDKVRIFRLGDNVWRKIQNFPFVPIDNVHNHGVYVNGSFNWLAIRNDEQSKDVYRYDSKYSSSSSIDQFLIISLDLSTEIYSQLMLPCGFEKIRYVQQPSIVVLMESLCFCHDSNRTDFVIWRMKEFGVEDSWIQLVKISYHSLPIVYNVFYSRLVPVCLSDSDDTLILVCDREVVLCSLRENRVKKSRISNGIEGFYFKNYVESLVSTH